MTDRIDIRGIRGFGRHGLLDEERRNGQEFVVDIAIDVDTALAGSSDDITHTVDYSAVAQYAHAMIEGEPRRLIESLAQAIAEGVRQLPNVVAVEVVVHKPHAPIPVAFTDVSVTVRR